MTTTPHLGLTLVAQSQAQKEVTVNTALTAIDAMLNTGAIDKDLTTPPGSPATGDVYIVAASPTGAWSGQAGNIAFFNQIWQFVIPRQGMTLWVNDESVSYTYSGSAWVENVPGSAVTGNSLGTGYAVYASTSGATLNFKSLVAGSNVTLSDDANTVTITASGGGGGGGMTGPVSSVDSEIALFSGTSGGVLKAASGTGYVKVSSGVFATESAIDVSGSDVTGMLAAGRFPALTGDVTTTAGSLATSIASHAVTYAKLQNETAGTLLGNPTGSAAAPSEITLGSTLAFSAGALQTGALTGDVTASANSFSTSIASHAVTYAKMQQASADTLLGNPTGSTANVEEITLGATLAFSSGVLQTGALSGDVTASANSFATTIASSAVTTSKINNAAVTYAKIQNASASTLLGNPTGSGAAPSEITLGAGLSFSGTTLTATGGGSGTVTSVAVSVPAEFSVSGSPVTTSGTITISKANESANTVWAGPTSGSAAAPAFRALVGADLPNPSSSALGGVQSIASVSHKFLTTISTSGVPALAQPAFSDISGTATSGQLPSDVAYTDVAQGFTAQQYFAATSLTDGASISWNVSANQVASVTLGGNRTLANPTNLQAGGTYILTVKQDGTGSRTLAYGSVYKWPGGTAPTLSTAASAVDILSFVSDGTNMYGVSQLNFH